MKKTLLFAFALMAMSINAQKLYTFGEDVEAADKQAYNSTVNLSNGAVLNSSGSTNTANGVIIQPKETGKWEISTGNQIDSYIGRISLRDSQSGSRTANIAVPVLSGQVIQVLFASSGDAARTLGLALDGTEVATFSSSTTKNVYLLGSYTATAAGTLTIYSKGSGMYVNAIGVGVSIPATTNTNNTFKNNEVYFNGTEIVNSNNIAIEVFNVLGKRVLTTSTSVSVRELSQGIYIIRAEGSKEVLKIKI